MSYFTYDTHRYFYREQGQGPLLLILPGNTASSACHANELAFFAGLGYHAASFDFLGTAQSDRIDGPWPLDWWQQNANAAQALIEHLGQSKAIVSGTSGGAISALWTAILHPAHVRAVISDSTNHTMPPGQFTREANNREARTPDQIGFWSMAQGAGWETVVNADSDLLRRLDAAYPEGVSLFQDRLSEIRCPALFTVSLTDSLLPDPGRQVAEMVAQVHGSWMFASNAGDHPLMWSCPQAFQSIARTFLETLVA